MVDKDEMKINIDKEKVLDCILSRLVEIETHAVFNTEQVKLIWTLLMKGKDPDFDEGEYYKGIYDELRKRRLELAADIIKRYS